MLNNNSVIDNIKRLRREYYHHKNLANDLHREYLALCDRREIGEDVSREMIEEAWIRFSNSEKATTNLYYQTEELYRLIK